MTAGLSLATALLQMGVTQKRLEYDSKESGMVLALLNGIPKIKVAGAEKRAFAKWAQSYAPSAQLTYNPPFLVKMNAPISQMITLGGAVVMYYLALAGGVSAADYMAFNSAYALVSGAFTGLVGAAAAVAGIRPSLNMAKPLFETAPEMREDKEVLLEIRQSLANLEINGPNTVIGVLPDGRMMTCCDSKKLRPVVVGRTDTMVAISSEVCGINEIMPERDESLDIYPNEREIVLIDNNLEVTRCKQ